MKHNDFGITSCRSAVPSLRAFRKAYTLTRGILEIPQRNGLSVSERLSSGEFKVEGRQLTESHRVQIGRRSSEPFQIGRVDAHALASVVRDRAPPRPLKKGPKHFQTMHRSFMRELGTTLGETFLKRRFWCYRPTALPLFVSDLRRPSRQTNFLENNTSSCWNGGARALLSDAVRLRHNSLRSPTTVPVDLMVNCCWKLIVVIIQLELSQRTLTTFSRGLI